MSRRLDPGKRHLIIRTALQVFGAKGFSDTTIRDIASSAGIAAGTIYTYFTDKDELFRHSFEYAWDEFHAGMEHILESEPDVELSVTRIIDFGFDLLFDLYPLVRGMYTQANLQDLLSPHLERLSLVLEKHFSSRSSLQIFGIVDNPELQRFFLKLMTAGILSTVSQTPPEDVKPVIAEVKQNLLRGLQRGVRSDAAAGGCP
ncbi:TetR/AcrR family transcriptional regulator [Spirochaeta africana]|uniref:Transcriptional regulator n=1 Tax=Spirochaeta africana (strain ATCC 700263 / DSM 8902 / Z-7692) TaxID=889378 RepID=H9UFB1_SPIAZ|nr:TetR/AcrR family transcriptional regulator [Spirochaeta africana]AFG36204.1 transcriptional regulator [Spirochaeta africana DSM 8902]